MRVTEVGGSKERWREVLVRNAGQVKSGFFECRGEYRKPMRCRNNKDITASRAEMCWKEERASGGVSIPTVDI